MRTILLIAMLALPLAAMAPSPALAAVSPAEMFDDPEEEARARAHFKNLRCVVCRNESIDESNADLATDMRLLVRERIEEGDSDSEIEAYMVERYGEFVLLTPTMQGANLILWVAAPVMFVVALGGAAIYLRRRRDATESGERLSSEEEARLRDLMRD